MRCNDAFTESLSSFRKLDKFVPLSLPLQPLRKLLNQALTKMDALFSRMYEAAPQGGRPSVPPDKLLYAMLLKMLPSVRS